MTWPPSLARIRVVKRGRRKLALWLPLILVWPVLVLLWVLLLPVIVVVAAALWRGGKGRLVLLGGPRAFGLFCATRGLSVSVRTPKENVQVRFW